MSSLPEPPSPQEIASRIKEASERILLATDFDGTLTETVPSPEQVTLPAEVLRSLAEISATVPSVVCSGRGLGDLTRFVPDDVRGLSKIGNHGLEWRIWREGKLESRDLTPGEWEDWREEFLKRLKAEIDRHGGMIEDKKLSLTLHYRESGREWWQSSHAKEWLQARMPDGIADILEGKMAWNILPHGASKGVALKRMAEEFNYQTVIYFGDEATDETVFRLEHLNFRVIGIKVGEEATAAAYRISGVEAVRAWFSHLAQALCEQEARG